MQKPLKIADFTLQSNAVMPAIAGYSDVAMRVLAYRYGAGLCCTEMISAKGLVYGSDNTGSLLVTDPREPIKAVQLFGREPYFIEKAIRLDVLSGFDIIDLNFGCPVPKIVKNGEGSALMREPHLVKLIVETAVEAAGNRPVTVKIRAGFSADNRNAVEVAKAVEAGGASAVTVHGRTRDMFYSGEADLDIIKAVKESVGIPVIGNGDVTDLGSYERMLNYTGVDGVAVARGAMGRPYIFAELRGEDVQPDIGALIREHTTELTKYLPEHVVVNYMKKHVAAYVKGRRGGKEIKLLAFTARTLEDIFALTEKLD